MTVYVCSANNDCWYGCGVAAKCETSSSHLLEPPSSPEEGTARAPADAWLSRAEQRASSWLLFAAPPKQLRNPPSPTPHEASPIYRPHYLGITATQLFTRRCSPLATPPSALPEPHSISLRLHHCTSPTTTTTPPTRLVVRLPSAVLTPGLSDSHSTTTTHHNVGNRSEGTCQQRQELGARCPRWLR